MTGRETFTPAEYRRTDFPLTEQPDEITCGPTCVKMILDHLGFYDSLGIEEIAGLCDTSPETGTTDAGFIKGFDALGLSWTRPVISGQAESTLDALRTSLASGNLVLLRTLVEGMKHWVIAYGYTENGFQVACPLEGAAHYANDTLHGSWAARDHDCFVIPGYADQHPEAVLKEAAWSAARVFESEMPHRIPLPDFMGVDIVIPNAERLSWCVRAVDDVRAFAKRVENAVHDGTIDLAESAALRRIPYFAQADFSFYECRLGTGTSMMVFHERSGEAVGCIHHGTRWVAEDWRGQGIGVEMILAAYSLPHQCFLSPFAYSESGWGSRLAAHRTAIQRALDIGLTVPDAVMADYALEDGTVRLVREPPKRLLAHPAMENGYSEDDSTESEPDEDVMVP